MGRKVTKKLIAEPEVKSELGSEAPVVKIEKVESDYEAHPKFAKFKKSLGGTK